ncbi:MAG: peptidylprolyl isomerase [Alteromonadaceae bacterium]|nr:MAG: peptidylprolyl isomerase [Alteromonadaceae bacterium]
MLSFAFSQYSYAGSPAADSKLKPTQAKISKVVLLPKVELKTSLGNIVIELYPDKAPITVANFLKYVDDGHYNGTIFHRVIDNFMAQAGGFTFDFQRKPTRGTIKNESDNLLENAEGTLAMARLKSPDSASSQFFINLRANPHLDAHGARLGYTVFAKVIEGYDIVKNIEAQERGMHRSFPNAPNVAIIIEKASRKK